MILKKILKIGNKYTIVNFDEKIGFLISRQFMLENVTWKGLDNYTLTTNGSKKELKWMKFIRLNTTEGFVMWAGHCNPLISTAVCSSIIDHLGGIVTVQKRWPALDHRYLIRAKHSVKYPPVSEYIGPLGPEVLITYQCIS